MLSRLSCSFSDTTIRMAHFSVHGIIVGTYMPMPGAHTNSNVNACENGLNCPIQPGESVVYDFTTTIDFPGGPQVVCTYFLLSFPYFLSLFVL